MAGKLSPSMPGLAALLRRRPLLTSAFIIAAVLTAVFLAKAIFFYTYWTDHRQQAVARWMTPDYIARAWKLDIEDIEERLDLDDRELTRRPIARIARQRGDNPLEYIEAIEELITEEYGDRPS